MSLPLRGEIQEAQLQKLLRRQLGADHLRDRPVRADDRAELRHLLRRRLNHRHGRDPDGGQRRPGDQPRERQRRADLLRLAGEQPGDDGPDRAGQLFGGGELRGLGRLSGGLDGSFQLLDRRQDGADDHADRRRRRLRRLNVPGHGHDLAQRRRDGHNFGRAKPDSGLFRWRVGHGYAAGRRAQCSRYLHGSGHLPGQHRLRRDQHQPDLRHHSRRPPGGRARIPDGRQLSLRRVRRRLHVERLGAVRLRPGIGSVVHPAGPARRQRHDRHQRLDSRGKWERSARSSAGRRSRS